MVKSTTARGVFVGARVARKFRIPIEDCSGNVLRKITQVFFGTVIGYRPLSSVAEFPELDLDKGLYKVRYDDGDVEHLDPNEVYEGLLLHNTKINNTRGSAALAKCIKEAWRGKEGIHQRGLSLEEKKSLDQERLGYWDFYIEHHKAKGIPKPKALVGDEGPDNDDANIDDGNTEPVAKRARTELSIGEKIRERQRNVSSGSKGPHVPPAEVAGRISYPRRQKTRAKKLRQLVRDVASIEKTCKVVLAKLKEIKSELKGLIDENHSSGKKRKRKTKNAPPKEPASNILLLRPLSDARKEQADNVMKEARRFVKERLRSDDKGKILSEFENQSISQASMASLNGNIFINDEIVNFHGALVNANNKQKIKEDNTFHKCYVANSFVLPKITGQSQTRSIPNNGTDNDNKDNDNDNDAVAEAAMAEARRIGTENFLGIKDDEVAFRGRDLLYNDLTSWPRKWYRQLFGKKYKRYAQSGESVNDYDEDSEEYLPTIFDLKLNMMVLPANLAPHHWFDVAVNFDAKEIVGYDSMPIINEHLDISHDATNILDEIQNTKVEDFDLVHLQKLCTEFGISESGSEADVMYRLMRIMYIQEMFLYVQKEGARTMPTKTDVFKEEWSLCLSSAMPKQNPENKNCAIFTCVCANILSIGQELSMLTPALVNQLENESRSGLAALAMEHEYVEPDNKEDEGEDDDEVEIVET